MLLRLSLLCATMLLAAACSVDPLPAASDAGPTADATAPSNLTYYKDVKHIIDGRCAGCHTKGGIGPIVLTNYDDIAKARASVRKSVVDGTMPPWPAKSGCADYTDDQRLTLAQIAAIKGWIDQGAKKGDPKDAKTPLAKPKELDRVDLTLKLAQPYTPPNKPDEYRCFILPWTKKGTSYITGFNVRPGARANVHHAIAFYAPPSQLARYRALDAAGSGQGYTCFGGPQNNLQSFAAGWLGEWAPGVRGITFAPGTGVRVAEGSAIILQIHYNTASSKPKPDQTAIDFRVAPVVARPATILPWARTTWVAFRAMAIPKGKADTKHTYTADPTAQFGSKVAIHTAHLHMHELGRAGVLRIERKDGTKECMLDIPKWDFNWQRHYTFAKPKIVNPGDRVYLECRWNNTDAAQPVHQGKRKPARDVNWGWGTDDEMCLGVFYVTAAP